MVVEGLRFVLFIDKPPSPVLREQRELPARQDLLRVSRSGILSEQDWNVSRKVIFVTERESGVYSVREWKSSGIIDFCRDGGV